MPSPVPVVAPPNIVIYDCDDSFKWPERSQQSILYHSGTDLFKRMVGLRLTHSSACTGLGTSGYAAAVNVVNINRLLAVLFDGITDDRRFEVEAVYGMECSPKSQEEILSLPDECKPRCLFANLLDFLPPSVRRTCDAYMVNPNSKDVSEIRALILNCTPLSKAWCVACGDYCKPKTTDLHDSGTPCKDHSSINKKAMKMQGKYAVVYYTWVLLLRVYGHRVFTHENVPNFTDAPLQQDLGDMYVMLRNQLCMSQMGEPGTRMRQFVFGAHRGSLVAPIPKPLPMILNDVDTLVRRHHFAKAHENFTFTKLLCATDEELRAEREWARNRKIVRERHANGDAWGDDPDSWLAALSMEERARSVTYTTKWPDQVGDLGQEPVEWPCVGKRGHLPCLSTQTLFLYSQHIRNKGWLLSKEISQAMGWPVRRTHVESMGVENMWSLPAASVSAVRSRSSSNAALGNAVHVHVIGAVLQCQMLVFAEVAGFGHRVIQPTVPVLLQPPLLAVLKDDDGEESRYQKARRLMRRVSSR